MKKNIFILLLGIIGIFSACAGKNDNSQEKAKIHNQNQAHLVQKQTAETVFNYPVMNQVSYQDFDSMIGKKIALQGTLTGEKFEHLVYYHPPFYEIAHFNLSAFSAFYREMPHIVIYFKRKTDLSLVYQEFLDQPAVIYGTFGKVSGAMLNVNPSQVKKRLEHTIYYVDVEKIEKSQ